MAKLLLVHCRDHAGKAQVQERGCRIGHPLDTRSDSADVPLVSHVLLDAHPRQTARPDRRDHWSRARPCDLDQHGVPAVALAELRRLVRPGVGHPCHAVRSGDTSPTNASGPARDSRARAAMPRPAGSGNPALPAARPRRSRGPGRSGSPALPREESTPSGPSPTASLGPGMGTASRPKSRQVAHRGARGHSRRLSRQDAPRQHPAPGDRDFQGSRTRGRRTQRGCSATFWTRTRSTPLSSNVSPATRMNSAPAPRAASTTRRAAATRSSRTRVPASPTCDAFIPICQSAV